MAATNYCNFRNRFPVRFIILALFLFSILSCGGTVMTVPGGFAEIEDPENLFAAVSPEGMSLSVKKEKNYPVKDAGFWGDALGNHLKKEGYTPFEGENAEGNLFTCPAGEGVYMEWVLPYRGETYTYLTAVVVKKKTLYVVEAGGEYEVYKSYRNEVKKSLETLSP